MILSPDIHTYINIVLSHLLQKTSIPHLTKSNEIHDTIIDDKIKQILTSLNDIVAINITMKTFYRVENDLKS